MATNILMPALSPTMEEGNLVKWHVKEGDKVKSGDVIAEIETDKATMEVEAVDEGRVGRLLVAEGTQGVKVNAPIAILVAEGEAAPAASAPTAAPARAGNGNGSAAPAPAKTAEPTPAPQAAEPGAIMRAGMHDAAPKSNGRVFASPLARRVAKEKGIDLAAIAGSGPHGRIVKADVEQARPGPAPQRAAGASAPQPTAMSDQQILKLYEPGSYEIVPHDNVRKIIARRLIEAKQTIPHFYLTLDTEIDALLKVRADFNFAAPKDKDGNPTWRISVNDFIIKAMAMALMKIPAANATWTEGGMLLHKHADIGVAVAIPGGLITPVVRKADQKRVTEISADMKDYIKRAKDRKLAPHEYQGGSTAISNLGMYGIKDFAAVINPPHSSILAVGAGIEKPVVRSGEIKIATIMTVTLSSDHRAVDGALGAELLTAFKDFIEKPASLLS
ncbi:MAG: pyruvate dehydrogenase complex dihydrolipoamide acetyltransferase [Bauldia sp.]|nr:pyruvate dehydrogenase complex dihydrolipoamide acetyltransferase [Bauldia sp.]